MTPQDPDPTTNEHRAWEQTSAASGFFAVLFFAAAFIVLLNTDPSGGNTPALPNIAHAEAAPAFIADHLNGIRAQVMLSSIGIVVFLWFLGTLSGVLRAAEGGRARGAAVASAGAQAGVALTLVGLMLMGTTTLTTSLPQAETVSTLYAAAALSLALGGGAFAVLYLAVAEVSLREGGLPKWLGFLSVLAAPVSVFGFVTPYAQSGIFNAATGGLGFYAHWATFVIWLLLASIALAVAQRRPRPEEAALRSATPAPVGPDRAPAPVTEGGSTR